MSNSDLVRLGILGAGMIATCDWGVLPGMAALRGRAEVAAIASRNSAKARAVADEWGIPQVFESLDALLASDVDAVVNLTPMQVHGETSHAILAARKHLVSEKPLASTVEEATSLLDLARRVGRHVVCSPPRMREPARIRARELVAEGAIGPVAFARVRSSHAGPAWRAWPVDPRPLYAGGAGPLIDMGVYGIQEITGILGPARRVFATAAITRPVRTARGGPYDGVAVPVTVPDNVLVTLELDDGVAAFVDCTFNVRAARSPSVEIFGHEGTIALHDGSPDRPAVELFRVGGDGVTGRWSDATGPGFAERQANLERLQRASLVEQLLDALEGRPNALSAAHALHTLEIVRAAERSAAEGRRIAISSSL